MSLLPSTSALCSLSPLHPFLVSAGIVLSLLLLTLAYRLWLHPLSHIPGPFFARCSTLWLNYHYIRGTWHNDIRILHEMYGPVVRISHYEISFVDADALKRIYGHTSVCKKTTWYDCWISPNGHGTFSEQDPETHSLLRRRAAQAYAMTSILTYEPKIQTLLSLNWLQFRSLSNTKTTPNTKNELATNHPNLQDMSPRIIDMDSWAGFFAYDVVSSLALGRAFGMLKSGSDVNDYMKSVLANFLISSNLGHVPLKRWWLNNPLSQFLFKNFGNETLKGTYRFREFVMRAVGDRYFGRTTSEGEDMLGHLMEAKDRDGRKVSFPDILKECSNILGAGADTTSIGIRTILYQILSHPPTKSHIQSEIDTLYSTLPPSLEISYKQCLTLPYLQAVIKESLRLHPSIVYQIPRYSPPEGITIAGYVIPPGWAVGISALAMNRCREVFGVDADVFRPERWLEDEKRARYMDGLLATFGMGPRTCIGKNIALVELNKWIAQFFRHFDAEIVNPEKPFKVRSFWFATQEEFFIRIAERRH